MEEMQEIRKSRKGLIAVELDDHVRRIDPVIPNIGPQRLPYKILCRARLEKGNRTTTR
jgi:hypothetical protein